MADKFMYISKDYTQSSVDYNLWLKHLDTQHNEPSNQNVINVPKVIKPNIILKLWGKTSVINSPMSPPLPGQNKMHHVLKTAHKNST